MLVTTPLAAFFGLQVRVRDRVRVRVGVGLGLPPLLYMMTYVGCVPPLLTTYHQLQDALTAMLSLELVALEAGQVLLVTGGAGMLGGSVLQLAHQAGLKVATNAAEADADLVRSLGADVVLPRSEGLSEAFKAEFGEADGLIDGALIGDHVAHLVKPGATAVSLRKSNPITDSRLNCTYVSVLDGMARPEMVAAVAEHIAKGTLKGRVAPDGVFAFTDARAAFEMAEANKAFAHLSW